MNLNHVVLDFKWSWCSLKDVFKAVRDLCCSWILSLRSRRWWELRSLCRLDLRFFQRMNLGVRLLSWHFTKICSDSSLLREELKRIAEFASWNGYPRRMVSKLIESFSPKTNDTANSTYNHDGQVLPTIWIHLPYIGNKGTLLIKSCTRKISRHDTTNSNTFLSLKDWTQKELKSSVVYKFICPGCKASYIGKTDRCLATRIKEHTYCKDSEIYKHINNCELFFHFKTLINLPHTLHSLEMLTLQSLILNNCIIIDK